MPSLATGTQMSYHPALVRAREEFGDREIKHIKPLDVERYIQHIADRGYSRQTVNVHLVVVRLIMRQAVIAGDIDADPCQYVKIPKHLTHREREPADDAQQAAVTASAPERPRVLPGSEMMWLFAYIAMLAGLRRGEILALRWSDLDTEDRKISVEKKLVWIDNRPVIQDFLKTAAGKRRVTMVDMIANVLPKVPKSKSDALVFPSSDGSPMGASEFRTAWGHYCLGIGCGRYERVPAGKTRRDGERVMQQEIKPDFTPHQLRHVYATICYDAGVDSKAASRELGHSKEAITRDIYTHISAIREKDTSNRLNIFLMKKVSSE